MNNDFIIENGTLVKYIGHDSSITIPEECIAIGKNAFSGCIELEHIIVPNSCQLFRNDAFASCPNLKTVMIRGLVINV